MNKFLLLLALLCSVTLHAASVTSLIDGTIRYLPEDGQIIKKGEVLVKYSESSIKIKIG